MNKKIKAFILVNIILIFLVVLFVISIFFISYSPKVLEPTFFTYKYQEIDVSKRKTTSGHSRVSNPISEHEEYISYRNSANGNLVILSHFSQNEFECTGSCFCDNQRRSSQAVLSRSLFLLISAFSASMALNIAKEAFQDHCEIQFADECDHTHLISEVQECHDVNSPDQEGGRDTSFFDEREEEKLLRVWDDISDKEYENYDSLRPDLEKKQEFICSGHCISSTYLREHSTTPNERSYWFKKIGEEQRTGINRFKFFRYIQFGRSDVGDESTLQDCKDLWLRDIRVTWKPHGKIKQIWGKIINRQTNKANNRKFLDAWTRNPGDAQRYLKEGASSWVDDRTKAFSHIQNLDASVIFQRKYLDPYCEKESMIPTKMDLGNFWKDTKVFVALCTAGDTVPPATPENWKLNDLIEEKKKTGPYYVDLKIEEGNLECRRVD